jgi:hypothetical protein
MGAMMRRVLDVNTSILVIECFLSTMLGTDILEAHEGRVLGSDVR